MCTQTHNSELHYSGTFPRLFQDVSLKAEGNPAAYRALVYCPPSSHSVIRFRRGDPPSYNQTTTKRYSLPSASGHRNTDLRLRRQLSAGAALEGAGDLEGNFPTGGDLNALAGAETHSGTGGRYLLIIRAHILVPKGKRVGETLIVRAERFAERLGAWTSTRGKREGCLRETRASFHVRGPGAGRESGAGPAGAGGKTPDRPNGGDEHGQSSYPSIIFGSHPWSISLPKRCGSEMEQRWGQSRTERCAAGSRPVDWSAPLCSTQCWSPSSTRLHR
ncbi:hypothetical protein SAMN00790413_05059 [Deinococcus hopiensis KR-140]|uniref:Uncharacterized protein n=1 Tax=Deinococcus hopiensis KR-140 TaxID=695939 RepID=A0A1W1UTE6_9DEIO|nr:hypothetical protein SAMN00790413_05059 [Deinococcus hopiensis KR-140]